MYELITDKTLAEYEAFVQSHPKGNFAQSSLWAKQKPMWTWDAVAVRGEDGKIKGSLALMTRKVPGIGRTLMYGCRGPVCDLDDRETFAQLLEGAKELAKKPNYLTVPAAIRELEKIEMTRQLDKVYRLDHAVTKTQKVILSAFGMDWNHVKYRAENISKILKGVQ